MTRAGRQPKLVESYIDREPGEECWPWAGTVNEQGYGRVRRESRLLYAHRVVYEVLVGPIPEGFQLDHLCRNPACVNPAHLEPVTQTENVLRGEGPTAQNARKIMCIRGHEFTPENTIRTRDGRRCRECRRVTGY